MKSKSSLLNSKFSHIYIENAAQGYELTDMAISKFPDATVIYVDNYKDVFNRTNQDFQLQKESQNLILAVKKDNFIYKGPDICQDFGRKSFYYTSTVLNCMYNCDYCYLQGMYPSANVVIFVNINDFMDNIDRLLEKESPYLTISYDTDMLAFEGIIPVTAPWLMYAQERPSLELEVRTKSSNYNLISHIRPTENIILAWTMSPDIIVSTHEKHTPSLSSRIKAAESAVRDGWKIRLCFDPLLYIDQWKEHYDSLIDSIFSHIPAGGIRDASIGVFRMSTEYLKRIRKRRKDSSLLFYPYEQKDGIATYPIEKSDEMLQFVYEKLSSYIPKEHIFLP